jgi:hypothetical protein
MQAGLGQTLDRVTASVGNRAITELDVTTECRFESFLEGLTPRREYDAAARKAALGRLVSQVLLEEQLQGAPDTNAGNGESSEQILDQVRGRYSSGPEYQAAEKQLGLSEVEIARRIEEYEQMLEMIDERFRPLAKPSQGEIAKFYASTFEPDYRRLHGGPAPALKEVEKQIREILVQQDINRLLSAWLDELRATQHVRIQQPE